jgi:hypothetical protein
MIIEYIQLEGGYHKKWVSTEQVKLYPLIRQHVISNYICTLPIDMNKAM